MKQDHKAPSRLLTDAFREVRRTMSRFLSILLLSALAVAFLAGLRSTAPDMKHSADLYFDGLNLMDLRVLSTLGVSPDDVDALSAAPGVARAEGAYTVDALLHLEDNDLILKAHSLSPTGLNAPSLREGRLPLNAAECLVEPLLLEKAGLALGDTLTLDTGDGDFADALSRKRFTIVGTADSPLYISIERGASSLGSGRVTAFVLLPEAAFDMDFFTEAYLLAEGASILPGYSSDYDDLMERLTDTLEPLGDLRAGLRYEEVVGEANEKLADAQRQYDEGKAEADAELDGARRELDDARRALDDARRELDDGWAAYEDGRATLAEETADGLRQIAEAELELPDALAELEQGELDYAEGVAELEDGQVQYRDGAAKLWSGRREYDAGYRELLDGEAAYEDSRLTLLDGEATYQDGYSQYLNGLAELEDGGAQLMEAKAELDRGLNGLFDGGQLLSAAREELAKQKNLYALQQTAYLSAVSAWAGRGIYAPGDEPEDAGDKLGRYLGGLLYQGDVSGVLSYYEDCVAPLATLLAQQRALAEAMGQDTAQLDALLAALPGDGMELLSALSAAPGLTAATLTGALFAPATVLDAMGQAIAAGEQQLAGGEAGLESGRWQYDVGLEQYQAALAEYKEGVQAAQKAKAELDEARAELDDGWAQFRAGRQDLDTGWAELSDAKAALDEGQIELDEAWLALVDGQETLDDARIELDDGWLQYQDGLIELADAKEALPREIEKAERELADALVELTDGESAYADGLTEYRDGLLAYEDGRAEAEAELSSARRELNDARRKISDIEDCKWYLLGRNTNAGYVSFGQDAERMAKLSSVFPVIFFLVAALVCLTTMTRMVEEQRVQIGCMKALGYGRGAIALKYVGYGFFASLLGGLFGLVAGSIGIPAIIFNAWKIIYAVGNLRLAFQPGVAVLSVAAAVLCVTGAALAASFAALSSVPAALMRPKAPPPGKRVLLERIRPLWRRMSFTHKVTVRNLLRYKKRFWMTAVGIAGCTALIVTGFGLRDSIQDILNKQYDEISTYSADVALADNVTDDELTELARALEQSSLVAAWMPTHQTSLTVESDSRSVDAALFAVEDPSGFEDFIHLRHRKGHDPVVLPETGAVLTEKLAAMLGVKVGDQVTLDGDRRVEVTVADITENYIFHYVYLTGDYYEALYGTQPAVNSLMVTYMEDTKENADEVSSQLISLSGVRGVSRIQDARSTFGKSLESVDYAVVLILFCAAALAFVVLYNLTNINITERLRELATLRVLGFYDGELAAYVYRENVLLTFFGVGLGLVAGKFLHQWLVLTVEIDMVMFGRQAKPMSYLFAVGLTLLFSFLVNLAARRRLRKIDMVESLKTVE